MNSFSFTLQDIIGSLLAFLLFPLIVVTPGYVIGWFFNLFDFRCRLPLVRIFVSIILSISVGPILIYLAYRLVGNWFVWLILSAFLAGFIWLILAEWAHRDARKTVNGDGKTQRYQIWALLLGAGWVVFCILCLVDIQIGKRLYYTVISLDTLTRAALIDAITRTGVPPINPSYYPGHPEPLTFLYYFWYILGSLIDQLGGKWVDSRAALIASVVWCGLGLMATIAIYLRLRNRRGGPIAWRTAFLGIGFLLVSGLDIIPVTFYMTLARFQIGVIGLIDDIEHWNDQITAWIGAVQWVPNHVASLIACLTGMMLVQSIEPNKSLRQKISVYIIAGLTFASALGLSVWVTLVFAIFWAVWMLVKFLNEKNLQQIGLMALVGVVALLAAAPFIFDLSQAGQGGSSPSGALPLSFIVRKFHPIMPFIDTQPMWRQNLVNLILLPMNYLLELGFFLLIGLEWWQNRRRLGWRTNPYKTAEVILFATTVILVTFLRSVIITGNDFGWRGWMFGQFVLLVWAVDIFRLLWKKEDKDEVVPIRLTQQTTRSWKIIRIFMVIGIMTTVLDLFLLRTYYLNVDSINPKARIGERTYAARLAYNFIRDNLPENVIVQDNPELVLDHPSGLYESRQMAISDHTAYGVPKDRYTAMVKGIGVIFSNPDLVNWHGIDQVCRDYSIDVLIYRDTDPFWSSFSQLEKQRAPLYQNRYFRIFPCGNYAGPS